MEFGPTCWKAVFYWNPRVFLKMPRKLASVRWTHWISCPAGACGEREQFPGIPRALTASFFKTIPWIFFVGVWLFCFWKGAQFKFTFSHCQVFFVQHTFWILTNTWFCAFASWYCGFKPLRRPSQNAIRMYHFPHGIQTTRCLGRRFWIRKTENSRNFHFCESQNLKLRIIGMPKIESPKSKYYL